MAKHGGMCATHDDPENDCTCGAWKVAESEVEELRARIAQLENEADNSRLSRAGLHMENFSICAENQRLQSQYSQAGDALTAIYMAAGLRPDPEDDELGISVIRDSVLESMQRLRADAERLDWLQANGDEAFAKLVKGDWIILRSAIDAARKEG